MWLLPLFPVVSSMSARVFYRLHVSGGSVPDRGPVLLAANHPNSLLDPLLVNVGARRPVRFLAKSPLFTDILNGWAVRAVGSIPVYRPRDDPAESRRNEETFRAVFAALAAGSAVAIFPEGISHHFPSLAPLKTGAARIALGAAPHTGGPFPIIPLGLVFEAKEEFRSNAYVVVGEQVEWSDLADRGMGDSAAVRELTDRIQRALHAVTINLQRWEDAPLVTAASEVYAAEPATGGERSPAPASRLAVAQTLARLHLQGDPDALALTRAVRRHTRVLAILGLTPGDVHGRTDVAAALRWTARRLSLRSVLTGFVTVLGVTVFWIPYRFTGIIAERTAGERDAVAMHKLLYGLGIFTAWIILLVLLIGFAAGVLPAVIALLLLPALALATLSYGERWTGALRDARSFFVRRSRTGALETLRARQRTLATQLRALYERELAADPRDR